MAQLDSRTRIGDADRERAIAELQRYVSEGYLSLDEFSDRSAVAYRATTRGELAAVTADLPANPEPGGAVTGRGSRSPVVIVAAVVVGVVLLAAVVMVLMMLGMMSAMMG